MNLILIFFVPFQDMEETLLFCAVTQKTENNSRNRYFFKIFFLQYLKNNIIIINIGKIDKYSGKNENVKKIFK